MLVAARMIGLRLPSICIRSLWLVNEWIVPSTPKCCLEVICTRSPICSGLSSGYTGSAATGWS